MIGHTHTLLHLRACRDVCLVEKKKKIIIFIFQNNRKSTGSYNFQWMKSTIAILYFIILCKLEIVVCVIYIHILQLIIYVTTAHKTNLCTRVYKRFAFSHSYANLCTYITRRE